MECTDLHTHTYVPRRNLRRSGTSGSIVGVISWLIRNLKQWRRKTSTCTTYYYFIYGIIKLSVFCCNLQTSTSLKVLRIELARYRRDRCDFIGNNLKMEVLITYVDH